MPERAILPLSTDDLAMWRGNIEKSIQLIAKAKTWWDANLDAYAPDQGQDPTAYSQGINTNRDFTLVERKKADLFYQRPDVSCVPSPLLEGQAPLLETHATLLNEKLGLDGVNAKRLVHQVLFDVLCPVGTGFSVMGYESVTVPTPTPDPLQPDTMVQAPTPVYEDCFWRWLSPNHALIPQGFRSTIWDDAPWMGYRFVMQLRLAKRKGWVPDTFKGSPPPDDLYFDYGLQDTSGSEAVVLGSVIYYKSALYRDDRVHPLHQTQLILIDGVDDPAEHQDSPFQTLDPQGKLTPNSLIGFPIHPLTIRVLSDSAMVPSDCTISRPIVNELDRFREQMVEQRDANTMRWGYNVDTLPTDALAKIVRSPIGGMIGLPGDCFSGGEITGIAELPHGSYPRENFQFNDYLDNDLARTHAIDAEQSGADTSGGDQTATEASIKQNNVNARLGLERGVVLDWYIKGVTKYSTLIQRYLPVQDAAAIVGPDQAQAWDSWRASIPASLAFTALPDSALRSDLAVERKRSMDEYTFFANDPFINRLELLKHLMPKLHYPAKVVNDQPPEKGPEPAKPTFSFKGEDLNPLAPQFPIVIDILNQAGLKIDPQAIAEAQGQAHNALLAQTVVGKAIPAKPGQPNTEHGGKVPQMESLSKHANALTGGMQGTGEPAPLGAGGTH